MIQSLHPPTLASLIICRNRPEFAPGSAISTLALFTVTRIGKREARFDLEHHRFSKHMPRAQIIDTPCRSLPSGAELLMRLPHVYEPAVRRAQLTSQPLPPTDFELIRRNLPETTICPLSVTDEQLVTAGEELGLEMPGPNSPLSVEGGAHLRRPWRSGRSTWEAIIASRRRG